MQFLLLFLKKLKEKCLKSKIYYLYIFTLILLLPHYFIKSYLDRFLEDKYIPFRKYKGKGFFKKTKDEQNKLKY